MPTTISDWHWRPLPYGAHLARLGCADLVLDTLPFNAHTTASDALWAGVPIVTFAGRVAASLLHATGLPDLVTVNLAEYESLARRLARDPSLLHSLRGKLQQGRSNVPLFDTDRSAVT
jgi:protein O-GlcNAc transferase